MSDARIETDSMGKVEVPADKLWGCADAALARALQHRARPDAARDDHRLRDPEALRGGQRTTPAVAWTTRPTN